MKPITKVLTEKGRRNNRTLSLSFMLPYSTVQVVQAGSHQAQRRNRPRGRGRQFQGDHRREPDADEHLRPATARCCSVNIPGVEIGDLVHSVTRQTIERAYHSRPVRRGDRFGGAELHPATLPTRSTRRRNVRLCASPCAMRSPAPSHTPKSPRRRRRGPSLGRPQCPAHVRRAGHAALTKWSCSAFSSAPCPIGRRSPNGTGT